MRYGILLFHGHSRGMLPRMNILRYTRTLPIHDQLLLEEGLLRADTRNWLLLSQPPVHQNTIVMGLSNALHPEQWLHLDHVRQDKVQLLRRYSGGGTVLIDRDALFASVICNSKDAGVDPYPRPIMSYVAERFFAPTLHRLSPSPVFSLRENDFCLGNLKFGGNAQSVTRQRWVHHVSMLWDMEPEKMSKYLLLPPEPKLPEYRQHRPHNAFLTTLKRHVGDAAAEATVVFDAMMETMQENGIQSTFDVRVWSEEECEALLQEITSKSYRKTTKEVHV